MRFAPLLLAVVCLSACQPGDTSNSTDQDVMAIAKSAPAREQGRTDPQSGLIIDENWEVVKAHCGACHSTQLVTQNRGDRETWLSLIRWMQETQGLWSFDPATEDQILAYLSRNYPPLSVGRRPPLDPALMPPSPYETRTP